LSRSRRLNGLVDALMFLRMSQAGGVFVGSGTGGRYVANESEFLEFSRLVMKRCDLETAYRLSEPDSISDSHVTGQSLGFVL